ncbi:ABC transporter substrate-binding protein [Rubrimonas cliftonensis]|uniref:ABC-type transport system, substrate-binding protein n=1 Tax=Rubrimonas cliftonensis TaxID=89524 RepID=A0A1H4AUE6_9RHOB|nr:ABC transporter substrate-binding protein [Rubrimonas cliftonensis]SEA39451.1 ABC-type transport system, substrate-binding protein [Rubrimonas cliftonensis]
MRIDRRVFITGSGAAIAGAALTSGLATPARAEAGHLRIAMTAADVPTTTGMPNNGAEGMRFLGYPVFEPLVDWDLANAADRRSGFRPGLAAEWSVDEETMTVWTFRLRQGVRFHDGAHFDADVALWNFARLYDTEAPHYDPSASAIAKARVPQLKDWSRIDDATIQLTTYKPTSFFPMLIAWIPMVSRARYEEVGDWNAFGAQPAGTGPFRITKVTPRVSAELAANADYWEPSRVPKVAKVTLFPMPEATTRLAALRSGQVDWIEVPPPDTIPSLEAAGFDVVTKIYPHIWPWVLNTLEGSPFFDKRVRQAINFGIDREGLVAYLNGTALAAKGFVTSDDVQFGAPAIDYGYDPERARALLKEAGYDGANPLRFKVMISTSGSGQMVPIPMNEYLQQSLAKIGVMVDFEVVEWGTMLVAFRQRPDDPQALGCHAMNISLTWTDPSVWFRWFHSEAKTPVSSNWAHWSNPDYDAIMNEVSRTLDIDEMEALLAKAHAVLVEESPWVWIVHDLNPRAFAPNVEGFVAAQSWMQDFTGVTVR